MAEPQRRLSAILVADVVGFSRLIGLDEEGTIGRLKALRVEVIDPAVARHHGRIVKSTGDGLLIEFASVVEATRCALAVQQSIVDREVGHADDRRIALRIGINVGDIVIDGDDILGDGVNVAARLEAMADAGGICVSGRAHDDLAGRIDAQFVDLGEQTLKNIARPVRVFRIALQGAPPVASPAAASDKLHSILVLPFASAGGQADQQDLAEAITDDLTHDLSRIPGTLVIAQSSANTLKGRSIDARAAAREFAVRYVVDGSVRIGADRVRINVQLVDAETGGQVWSDRIEAPRAELADLQDNVSGRIAWALELELPGVESRRGHRGDGHSPDAFELGMLGWSLMNRAPSRENIAAAEGHFRKAYELDPRSVPTRIGLSFTHVRKVSSYWSDQPQEELVRSNELIDPVLTEAPRHDRAHFVKGLILRTEVQPEQSSVFFERAMQLNPNYAQAIAFLGFNQTLVGRPERCFELVERAIRLSPRDPQLGVWLSFMSQAHHHLQQYDQAIEVSIRSVAVNPEYGSNHLRLATANALVGRREEAKTALANAMRLLPGVSARLLRSRRMSTRPAYVEAMELGLVALREFGLPD